jgi:hypothetical protein
MKNVTFINRVYPGNDWDYKAVVFRTTNTTGHPTDLVYGIIHCGGHTYESFETYTGENYINGAPNKSYSRATRNISSVPELYANHFKEMKEIHEKTLWSTVEKS